MVTNTETAKVNEIKRLLRLSEIAQSKVVVEHGYNGTKTIITNPMQQAAAKRTYNKARKLGEYLGIQGFIDLHNEVVEEMSQKISKPI